MRNKKQRNALGRVSTEQDDKPIEHTPPPTATKVLAVHRGEDEGGWDPVVAKPIPPEDRERNPPPGPRAVWEYPAERGAFSRYASPSRHGARYEGGGYGSYPELEAFYQASVERRERQRDVDEVMALIREIPLLKAIRAGKMRPRPGQPPIDIWGTTGVFLLEICRALVAGLMGTDRVHAGREGARLGGTRERTEYKDAVHVLETSLDAPELGRGGGASLEVALDAARTGALWHFKPNGGPEIACKASHSGPTGAKGHAAVDAALTAKVAVAKAGIDPIDLQGLIDWKVGGMRVDERIQAYRRRLLVDRGVIPESVYPPSKGTEIRRRLHNLRRELATMGGMNAMATRPAKTLADDAVVAEDLRRREEAARRLDVEDPSGRAVPDPEIRPRLQPRSIDELTREVLADPDHWAWPDRFSHEDRLRIMEATDGGKRRAIFSSKRIKEVSEEIVKARLAVYRKFVGAVVALAVAGKTQPSRANQNAINNLLREIMPDIVLVGSRQTHAAFVEIRGAAEDGQTLGIVFAIERLMAAMRADIGIVDDEMNQGDLLRVFIKDIDDALVFFSVMKVGG